MFDVESVIRLGVAAVLGALIGLERGKHGRPAGLRTHALVSLGSALLIVVSRTGALVGLQGPDNFILNVDPSRMAAGIVTGIGFLGAGAILRIRESLVRGLTTAACIWFVAAVGVAVGLGEYVLAAVATGVALVILSILDRVEMRVDTVDYRNLVVVVETDKIKEIEQLCADLVERGRMRIQATNYQINNQGDSTLEMSIRVYSDHDSSRFASDVATLPGVRRVRW